MEMRQREPVARLQLTERLAPYSSILPTMHSPSPTLHATPLAAAGRLTMGSVCYFASATGFSLASEA